MPLVKVSVDQALLTKLILPFCSQILKSHKHWRSSMRFHEKKSLELAKTMPHIKEIECVFFFISGFFAWLVGFFACFRVFSPEFFIQKSVPKHQFCPSLSKTKPCPNQQNLLYMCASPWDLGKTLRLYCAKDNGTFHHFRVDLHQKSLIPNCKP